MNKNTLLLVVIFVMALFIFSLYYYYLNVRQKSPESPLGPTAAVQKEAPPVAYKKEDLPVEKVDPTTKKTILEIPFNFVVKSVSPTELLFQKEGGTEKEVATYYPKQSNIKVYKGLPPDEQPATIDDVIVGKKIKVKNIPNDTVFFYILD